MTDEANANGPVETPTTATEAPDTNAAAVGDSVETWATGLQSEDNRAFVKAKNWKNQDDQIASHRELEKLIGKSFQLPGDKATPEEWAAFNKKLGVPDSADGYELKLNPDLVPTDFPYDEGSAKEFRAWAHEAGVTPRSAQVLHDRFVAQQAQLFKAANEEARAREEAAHREIVTAWGDPSSDAYKENLTLASRAISELGLKEAFEQGNLTSADGAVKNANLAMAMARIGQEMFKEGSATSPGKSSSRQAKDTVDILYGS